MAKSPMERLQALEKSLGGPGGAPLLVGLDEPDEDIVEALACLDADAEYCLRLREFRGAPTLIVSTRKATLAEVTELEKLYEETAPAEGEDEGDEDGEGDEDEDGEDDEDE